MPKKPLGMALILPNISRSKGNQTMKLDQLIECNMRNVFLEKSFTKCGGETIPWPFSKKPKLSISLDQQSRVSCRLFLLYAKSKAIKIACKLSCRPLDFASYNTFPENKKRSGTNPPAWFSAKILKKNTCYILSADKIWLSGCYYFVRY